MKLINEVEERSKGEFIKYLQMLVKAEIEVNGFWNHVSVETGPKPWLEQPVVMMIQIENNGKKVKVEVVLGF